MKWSYFTSISNFLFYSNCLRKVSTQIYYSQRSRYILHLSNPHSIWVPHILSEPCTSTIRVMQQHPAMWHIAHACIISHNFHHSHWMLPISHITHLLRRIYIPAVHVVWSTPAQSVAHTLIGTHHAVHIYMYICTCSSWCVQTMIKFAGSCSNGHALLPPLKTPAKHHTQACQISVFNMHEFGLTLFHLCFLLVCLAVLICIFSDLPAKQHTQK